MTMRIDTDKQMNLLSDKNVAIIGGGPVGLTMAKLLQQKLGYRVTIANPFLQMGFSPQIDIKKIENDASSLMVACGLALRSFD